MEVEQMCLNPGSTHSVNVMMKVILSLVDTALVEEAEKEDANCVTRVPHGAESSA